MAEEVSEKPTKELPYELEELKKIIEKIDLLARITEETHKIVFHTDSQQRVQKQLKKYSEELALLPKILQLLNDLRRHIPDMEAHATNTQSSLVALRGEEDAITSEEARVLISVEGCKKYLLATITTFEYVLAHVRQTAHLLIGLISYHDPGFKKHLKETAHQLRLDYLESTLRTEQQRLQHLLQDVKELYGLDAHIEEVQDA